MSAQFAAQCCEPEAAELDETHLFLYDTWNKMTEVDLLRINHDEKCGGTGHDAIAEMIVIEELSKASLTHGSTYALLGNGFPAFIEKFGTEEQKAEFIPQALNDGVIGATNIGRDLAPRCAARLHTGLCADCTHLDIDVANYIQFLREASTLDVDGQKWDMEDRNLKMTRPAFGGHLMATIICPRFRPCMATVRPGVMKKNAFDQAKADACVIEKPAFTLSGGDIHTEVTEVVKAAKKLVDLIGADFIVSVGRGISKDVEGGIKLAEELAAELGGVVGGSRATIDSGWLSADHQVGQTGKTVHPKVYVALGISGAIQHKAGMQDSECIIAVNKNDTAPIFEIADYGICGDLFKVTPLLTEAIRAAKAAK